ncbi:MAG: RNase adapter RapZ [Gammaproteobacteria bacterium]
MSVPLRLILVSGLSGAGKSVVLNALEDLGYRCVDNLPSSMLESFVSHVFREGASAQTVAIGIDARDTSEGLDGIPTTIEQLRRSGVRCELLVVTASDGELLRRFGETKRRHPLSREGHNLQDAVTRERALLDPVIQAADLVVDTTHMGVHELRDAIVQRIDQRRGMELSVTLVSFGFKHGVPGDCDFVFDVRMLPNPYWTIPLRALTGRDQPVINYLNEQPAVGAMLDELQQFISRRIEDHGAARRRYLTVGIGCTGGQHRSVYLVDRLAERLRGKSPTLAVRHSSLVHAGAS